MMLKPKMPKAGAGMKAPKAPTPKLPSMKSPKMTTPKMGKGFGKTTTPKPPSR